MNININAIRKQMRALAKHSGLTIKEEDREQPRTDGSTIYIPRYNPSWDKNRTILWWYYTIHEMGHNRPETRDCFDIPKKYKISMQSFIGSCLNVLDDDRQEHSMHGHYPFIDNTIGKGRRLFLDKQLEEGGSQLGTGDDHRQAMEALYTWDTMIREKWLSELTGASGMVMPLLTEQSRQWVDKLSSGDYEQVLNTPGLTAEEEYSLTKRIISEVFGFDAEEEEKDGQEQAEQESNDDSGDEEGEEGQSGAGVEGAEEGATRDKKVFSKYEDLIMHQHKPKPSFSPMMLDYTDYEHTDGYVPTKSMVVDYEKGQEAPTDHTRGGYTEYKDRIDGASKGRGLSNRVRRLLQILSKDKRTYGHKAGKIHSKNLYRLGMKEAKGFNERVFKKKESNLSLDVSVSVLCDFSGSMGGDRIENAGASCVLLSGVLQTLGIDHEVLGFTSRWLRDEQPLNYMFKSMNKRVSREKLIDRLADATNNMGENADGESILWAYNRILPTATKRKILIVLSDGQPAYHNGTGSITTFTRDVINKIQKENNVEIVGIGIQSTAVERYYKHHTVIDDSSSLESALFDVIKTKILA